MSTSRTGLNSYLTVFMFLLGFLTSWSTLSYGEVSPVPEISGSAHQATSLTTSLCLDMTGGDHTPGALSRGFCRKASGDHSDQLLTLRSLRGGYQTQAQSGQKCSDISKAQLTSGVQAWLISYRANAHLAWDFRADTSGEVVAISRLDRGQCLYIDSATDRLRIASCDSLARSEELFTRERSRLQPLLCLK